MTQDALDQHMKRAAILTNDAEWSLCWVVPDAIRSGRSRTVTVRWLNDSGRMQQEAIERNSIRSVQFMS